MSDTPETAPAFEPYPCSLGTVIGHDGDTYLVAIADGRTIGIRANGEPSAENVEADIANQPALPDPVPEAIGPAQLRIAMRHLHGITAGEVHDVLNALPEPDRADAYDLWEYATSIKRTHPLVLSFANAFGLTSAEVDDVFRLGITL